MLPLHHLGLRFIFSSTEATDDRRNYPLCDPLTLPQLHIAICHFDDEYDTTSWCKKATISIELIIYTNQFK